MTSPTTQIILDSPSRAWRRRLGPLPWAILEELAQQVCRRKQGWVVAIGVRDLGAAVGVTKDTAARALATLRSAGIVTPARVQGAGHTRSGYRLNLPDGLSIRSCPNNQDTDQHDNVVCPDGEYATQNSQEDHDSHVPAGRRPTAEFEPAQISLFALPAPQSNGTRRESDQHAATSVPKE